MIDTRSIPQLNTGLWQHQIENKNHILQSWGDHNAVMLQMPTGTGKTYLFTSLINDLLRAYKKERVEINILIVAHRTELLDQISESLNKFGIPHGFIQGPREQHLWRRVQVASIQSLLTSKNYRNTERQRYDFIIVDEAHHSLADTYKALFNLFPKAKKLGVTATPCRLNRESFLPLYDTLITSRQISWFIQNGILSDFDYVSIKPDSEIQNLINRTEVAQTGDFVNAALDFTFNTVPIRAKLYESYLKFAKGRKGIVYAINRRHALKIASMYSSHGIKAVAIDCETPKEERQFLIEQFKEGNIRILVNVDIFTEGFDCPDVSFIQLARPTRSLTLYLQQVGRGLRKSKGKDKTIILDNVGLYNYFGLPDANRRWQYHFKGGDAIEEYTPLGSGNLMAVHEPSGGPSDDSDIEEDDEQMEVIHGTAYNLPSEVETADDKPEEETPEDEKIIPILEFEIADYYLVRGNHKEFRIYPLTKKRGKKTDGVSGCIYEYIAESNPMILTDDATLNAKIIHADTKLHTIISFSSIMLGMKIEDILNIAELADKTGYPHKPLYNIFDLLLMLSRIKPRKTN